MHRYHYGRGGEERGGGLLRGSIILFHSESIFKENITYFWLHVAGVK